MSASGHHASMKMQDPFCSGRCPTVPVFVLSVSQRGSAGHRPQRIVDYFRSRHHVRSCSPRRTKIPSLPRQTFELFVLLRSLCLRKKSSKVFLDDGRASEESLGGFFKVAFTSAR